MRRLIEIRANGESWQLTPPFEEQVVRLSYVANEGIQSILVAQSVPFYPVQLSNIKAFTVKAEKDVFQLPKPLINNHAALAIKAIPSDFLSRSAWCRVVIEVSDPPEQPLNEVDVEQNLLLSTLDAAISDLQTAVNGLTSPAPSEWIEADLGGRWLNFETGFAPASFAQQNGIIYMRGGIVSQGDASIFQLPAGFRPEFNIRFTIFTASFSLGNRYGAVQVGADGWVTYLDGYGDYFALDGVSFKV